MSRLLVTYGSKMGGTKGIAEHIGETLQIWGFETDVLPARSAEVDGYDAVLVGGALYANRWHKDARRFVRRNAAALRRLPVWFFSSGPLDDSATETEIPPTGQVADLMERAGARAHTTFGGRLTPDAKGFLARAMARENSGDWREPEEIRAWAEKIATELQ